MNLTEIIRQSLDSLLRNRLRSGLTMLGIVWGLVTVVLLLSYGKSLGEGVLNGFSATTSSWSGVAKPACRLAASVPAKR